MRILSVALIVKSSSLSSWSFPLRLEKKQKDKLGFVPAYPFGLRVFHVTWLNTPALTCICTQRKEGKQKPF